ncbi:hypothetical protein [Parafrankia sp. BMG5.11]|uniref:hypothetical protein n=1 Tax=Parafrankia sp. BMG5.11 TaxID=222540 RepID=UPI00103E4454|nr:hypothetical protein [Parafrankia sp. BMG5.11]TCJ38865.1 hypothetical protein E0504_11150 [Parafrankia sp. BMG5.11]
MANYFTQFSTTLQVNKEERAMLEQALGFDWDDDDGEQLPTLLQTLFLDRSAAVGAIFPDPECLSFELDYVSLEDDGISLGGADSPNLEAIANLIQLICQETLSSGALGFEWATTCDKLRPDAFSGGWCVVSLQEIRWETTSERLAAAMAEADFQLLLRDQC